MLKRCSAGRVRLQNDGEYECMCRGGQVEEGRRVKTELEGVF